MFPAWDKFNTVRFQVLIAKMLQNICNIYQSTKCNISDNLNIAQNTFLPTPQKTFCRWRHFGSFMYKSCHNIMCRTNVTHIIWYYMSIHKIDKFLANLLNLCSVIPYNICSKCSHRQKIHMSDHSQPIHNHPLTCIPTTYFTSSLHLKYKDCFSEIVVLHFVTY